MMHGFGFNGWGMGLGWLIGIVILVVIIWLTVKLVNQGSNQGSSRQKSAMDILKERYAKGEISKEEFEEKKKHIE